MGDALTRAECQLHYRILATLKEYGPTSQATLGRRTAIDRSDVVATVDGLVARGYATRGRDPDDLRRNVIRLTAAGASHFRRLDRLILDVQDQLLGPLTTAERETFVAMLRRICEE
jgi:DNA-binding MarR family transcriptional regulator